MYTIPTTCPHRIRTLTQRGQGNQRLDCLYFALPSEQAVNLCLASAYLGACHRSPAQGERHHTPQPSLAFPWAQFSLADWRRWLQIELFSPFHSPKFAFICSLLSLLFCCVCFLSGSRSESVSACCFVSYQLWQWPAIVVMQGFYWC